MKALSKLYLANLTEFLSNRTALFLTIAFPVIFIVIFGAVFTNQDKADADIGLVIEEKADPISQQIVEAIESAPKGEFGPNGKVVEKEREKNPFSELKFREGTKAALVEDLRKGRLDAVITIPAGLAKQAAAMKERAMRDAAGQLEKMQREQSPTQADAPGQATAPGEAARPAAMDDPRAQAALAAAQPTPATPPPLATATPEAAKTRAGSASRSRAGRSPGPTPTPKLAEPPLPSPATALSLSPHPAPVLLSAPAAQVPFPPPPPTPSALVRKVEVVEDSKPLTPAQLTLTIDPARQLLRPVLQGLVGHILSALDASLTGQTPLADLRTDSIQARELRTIDYLLPGILALSIMQLGLFATAQPLVALRVQGVLKRLNATPLPRTTLLIAYIAFRLTIALFQTMLTVIIGRYAFEVAMVGSWLQFSSWVLLGTLVFLSVGFFIAAVSKNEESCIAIGIIINLPMILLSGVFFPVNHLSRLWDYIIMLVPLNYLADALRTTMVDAPPLHSSLTNALVLGGWVVVMSVLAVRFFSWESR